VVRLQSVLGEFSIFTRITNVEPVVILQVLFPVSSCPYLYSSCVCVHIIWYLTVSSVFCYSDVMVILCKFVNAVGLLHPVLLSRNKLSTRSC